MSFFGNASGSNNKKKNKYKELTLAIKQIVLERSKNRCQECSKKLTGTNQPQFIHINGKVKDNRPENLKVICTECSGGGPSIGSDPKVSMLGSLKRIFTK